MDNRLLLFLNVHQGLKLSKGDIANLLRLGTGTSAQELEEALQSPEAVAFVCQRDWQGYGGKILEVSRSRGIQWSFRGHADYPDSWLGLSTQPLVFSYLGTPVWKTARLLSVVGSRHPMSDTYTWMQREFKRFLCIENIGVASGGARGVDQWAHRLAMDCRRPTVCVAPSGLMRLYPPQHEELWDEIVESGGCVLSTFALDAPMRKSYFAIRNRWIAGLSPVCFVVEANQRSGSMLTAQLALRENRVLATLPVSPISRQGMGNLQLLADGAQLIRDAEDLSVLSASGPRTSECFEGDEHEDSVDKP